MIILAALVAISLLALHKPRPIRVLVWSYTVLAAVALGTVAAGAPFETMVILSSGANALLAVIAARYVNTALSLLLSASLVCAMVLNVLIYAAYIDYIPVGYSVLTTAYDVFVVLNIVLLLGITMHARTQTSPRHSAHHLANSLHHTADNNHHRAA